MSASREYSQRLEARRADLAVWKQRHLTLGRLRVGALTAVIALIVAIALSAPLSGWWLAPLAVAFFILGGRLQRAETESSRLERASTHYEHGLARVEGRWADVGHTGERFLDPKHLYSGDLDLFGESSLFQLLSTARTRMGEDALASWLLEPSSPDVVRARHECVRELGPKLELREDLAVLGSAGVGVHPEALLAWAATPSPLASAGLRTAARTLGLLGALAIPAAILYVMHGVGYLTLPPPWGPILGGYFTAMVLTALGMLIASRKRVEQVTSEVERATRDLDLLSQVLARLETESFSAGHLNEVQRGLGAAGARPSERVAKLHRLIDLYDLRANQIFAPFAVLMHWDLNLSIALEDWRQRSGPALGGWLDAVGEIEALTSLGAFHYERPAYVFPKFVDESPFFEGQSLAHPLLPPDGATPNDVQVSGDLRAIVVSGSNMSGKSTLLRTVGVNTVLAQAGAPVRAASLRLSPLRIGASIQIVDSLQEGASKFYAEITRLREIMQTAQGETPVLFLIDEFLHGTNSHDRKIGAEAIVRGLVDRNAIGFITTHDLALAHIADEIGDRGRNVHFEDHLEDGEMRFDYRMRPGIVEKSNAVELMRSVGLEV